MSSKAGMQPQETATNDDLRKELETERKKLARIQRELNATADIQRKIDLSNEEAATQRSLTVAMRKLGLTQMPPQKGKKGKTAHAPSLQPHLLPTEEVTVEQMLTLSAAGKATPEGAAELAKAAESAQGPVVMPWVPPPFPPMPDAQSVAAYFGGAKTFTPLQAVLRSPKDPHFKKEGGLKNLATVAQPPQYVGQDAEWIALLQQIPARFSGEREALRKALERAVTQYCVTSGPLEGWLARLKAGDDRPHPLFSLTEAELGQVFAVLPWDDKRVFQYRDRDLLEVLKGVTINAAASAGMPRMKKKGEVLAKVLEDAVQYYELLTKKGLPAFQRQFPGEFLTLAKAKLDRYEIAEWGKKIRPYYCANGGLALLYSCVVQNYSKALEGFWENPASCNAHGFAWNSGGGDRLYSWVLNQKKRGPGVYAIGYSDDGLWVIVTEDGKVLVSDKDVEQMDASCGNSHLPNYRAHVHAVLKAVLTEGWTSVANAACQAVFKQLVLLYKSLVYASDNKIHSGLPGTAEADQVAFATAYVLVRTAYQNSGASDPVARFDAAAAAMTARIGLRFKPSAWHEFVPDQETYPWSFLGKTLARYKGHYVPVVSLEKAVVQLVTPKKTMGGTAGQRAWMERCRGLTVTTLYWHPVLYAVAKAAYERKIALGVRPAATLEGEATDEGDLVQIMGTGVNVKFPDETFPKWEWIMQLYTGLELPGRPLDQSVVVLAPVKSAADFFDEIFPEAPEAVAGTSWADTPMDHPARTAAQLSLPDGAAQRLELPVLPQARRPEEQYQMAPLPAAVKEAYNANRLAYYRRVAAETQKKHKGYVRGGAVERLETGEAHVVFTANGIKLAWEAAYEEDFNGVDPRDVEDEDWVETVEDDRDDAEYEADLESEGTRQIEDAWQKAESRRQAARGTGKRPRREDA